MGFYRELMELKSDDVLKEASGVESNQLTALFRITFGPGPMDNFLIMLPGNSAGSRKALQTRKCCQTCPKYVLGEETVLHAFVLCPCITDLWNSIEQLLARIIRICLSAKSKARITPLFSIGW